MILKVETNNDERELETIRLRLRPCLIDHLDCAYDLWTNEHIRHFLFDGRVVSLDEARSFVEASLANFEELGYGLWLVFEREGDCLVGFAGFLQSEGKAPNLIYGLHPDFCGKGYATEAAGAVLKYALESLALPLVKADVDEPNVNSIGVLEKLGMKRTGRAIVAGRPLVYFQVSHSERSRATRSGADSDCLPWRPPMFVGHYGWQDQVVKSLQRSWRDLIPGRKKR